MIPRSPALEKAATNSIIPNLTNAATMRGYLVRVNLVIQVFQFILLQSIH